VFVLLGILMKVKVASKQSAWQLDIDASFSFEEICNGRDRNRGTISVQPEREKIMNYIYETWET